MPQIGPEAVADAVLATAQEAEDLGYDSLWVFDRLLYPVLTSLAILTASYLAASAKVAEAIVEAENLVSDLGT